MAKLKMLKAPKRPKASASVATKEAYLKRLSDINRENNRRRAENAKSRVLDQKIAKALNGFRK